MIFIDLTVPTGDEIYVNILQIACIRQYEGSAKTLITLITGENIGVIEEYQNVKDRIDFRLGKTYGF